MTPEQHLAEAEGWLANLADMPPDEEHWGKAAAIASAHAQIAHAQLAGLDQARLPAPISEDVLAIVRALGPDDLDDYQTGLLALTLARTEWMRIDRTSPAAHPPVAKATFETYVRARAQVAREGVVSSDGRLIQDGGIDFDESVYYTVSDTGSAYSTGGLHRGQMKVRRLTGTSTGILVAEGFVQPAMLGEHLVVMLSSTADAECRDPQDPPAITGRLGYLGLTNDPAWNLQPLTPT